ncbi:MAG: hypothetical protein J6C29_04855 [Clostridia bacterium]|nr:hypothetical protein [Clostridia bacterium]MBO5418104.1 hypothetical protein [Clostridia bacterium]
MANYKVNEKSKTISVSGALTEIERGIISTYILNGYKVKEKREATAARVSNKDIIAYFDEKKDEKGKEQFEAEKNKKMTDKKGKERKAGFLVALKWFKANYADAYKEIADSKKK